MIQEENTNTKRIIKRKGKDKFARKRSIQIHIDANIDINNNVNSEEQFTSIAPTLKKPDWIRVKAPNQEALALKQLLREHKLHSVCEEASCPNLAECFAKKIATFMILGDICTRRCSFCDVAFGKPKPVDPMEPINLSIAISKINLKYVVITSVDRDDLPDAGAGHFANCISAIRQRSPNIKIEILVPDFRNKMAIAIEKLANNLPDVFNHNIETVPRLYKTVRAGSSYLYSLQLIKAFKQHFPELPTKSGIMLGLGETDEEVREVLVDLRKHNCDMLTIGQYLQPTKFHAPVTRFVTPEQFDEFAKFAYSLGFVNVASGALVRSSYHAEEQAKHVTI